MQTIACCRHNDGDPFELRKIEELTVGNETMEECLLERAVRLPSIDSKKDKLRVRVCQRRDAVFLKCIDMAKAPSIRSILGIAEDHQSPRLEIDCYRASMSAELQQHRMRRGPRAHWKRSERKREPPHQHKTATRIRWIDLRNFEQGRFLSTEAGVVHFLRSVLGSSHEASPWVDEESSDGKSPDIVVVVVEHSEPSLLRNFRVSDAAPSWFLHGFAVLEHLEDSPAEIFGPRQQSAQETCESDVLVYKRLGPRPLLRASRPDDAENEKGCLWEECHPDEPDTPAFYRLVSPPYLNLEEEYPGVFAKLFSPEALEVFTRDALSVPQWTPWPETTHYRASRMGNEQPWTVFPLCHCFPANAPENFAWIDTTKSFVPKTCALLENALSRKYLRTALFSRMAPGSVLEEHSGWAELANHVLRLHIPLVVPSCDDGDDDLCGTWVDGCVEPHVVGRPILFDDSKIHRAFNYSTTEDRIVLIVDLARPDSLPEGTGSGGRTDELDAYLQQLSTPK